MESIRELVDEGPIGKRRLPVLSTDELSDVRGGKKVAGKVDASAVRVVGAVAATGTDSKLPSAEEVDEEYGLEPAEPAEPTGPDEADINREVEVDDLVVDF